MELDEMAQLLLAELPKGDHPVEVGTAMGRILKGYDYPEGGGARLLKVWQEWRTERKQGAIPPFFEIPG